MTVPPEPPEPPEPAQKPTGTSMSSRLGASPRDLVISMLILLPIVGLVAMLGRGCSFSPGGPTADPSSLPSIDPRPALLAAAPGIGFPLRLPTVGSGWRATVVDLNRAPGDLRAARVSWITAGGRYLRLVQSGAEEGALVAAETEGPPTGARPVQVAGTQWVDYTGQNGEQAWAHRADGVEWLITGDGQPAEFAALAGAVQVAPPLPTER